MSVFQTVAFFNQNDLSQPMATQPVTAGSIAGRNNELSEQLNLAEIPEMILVESIFIPQQTAVDQGLLSEATCVDWKQICEDVVIDEIGPILRDAGIMAIASMNDKSTITETPFPKRERAQQTEASMENKIEIGIQCSLDYDMYFECDISTDSPTVREKSDLADPLSNTKSEEQQRYQHFVQEKSCSYSNGKQECLICGEIEISKQRMSSHMAMHWGPEALCENCGAQLEHAHLLSKHRCIVEKIGKRQKKNNFQCPIYYCGMMTKSRFALYDHINDHMLSYNYACMDCRQKFRTFAELYNHHEISNNCSKRGSTLPTIKRISKMGRKYHGRMYMALSSCAQRVLIKSRFKYRTNAVRRCHICLWHCKSSLKFAKHRLNCIRNFVMPVKKIKSEDKPLEANGDTDAEYQQDGRDENNRSPDVVTCE